MIKLNENIKYNGWTNYPTWCVSLWLNNEEGSYFYLIELAKEIKENPRYFKVGDKKYLRDPNVVLGDAIKKMIDDSNPLIQDASLFHDVLTHALAFINYQEIAKGFLEE